MSQSMSTDTFHIDVLAFSYSFDSASRLRSVLAPAGRVVWTYAAGVPAPEPSVTVMVPTPRFVS